MKKILAFLLFVSLNFNIFALNLKSRNNVAGANYLDKFSQNYKGQEYSNLLAIIDGSYLQVREALLDSGLVPISSDGYGKIFCLLQNIFSSVLDFSNDIANQDVRDIVLIAFAELVLDLFQEVSLERLKLAYPWQRFDFWEEFCAKGSIEEKDKFVRSSFNFGDRSKVTNIVDEVFLILFYYLYECIEKAINHIKDTMDFYFDGKILKGKGKKKQTAAIVFGAIANACMQTGQLVNKPQQQGALGLFGIAFNAASQIATVHANAEIEQQQSQEEQKGWLTNQILSSKLTQKIISGILSVVGSYLQEKLEEFLKYLSHKLIELICQKASKSEDGIVVDNQTIEDNYFFDDKDD